VDWTVFSVAVTGAVATVAAALLSPWFAGKTERFRLRETREDLRQARRLDALYAFQEAFQKAEVAAFSVVRLGFAVLREDEMRSATPWADAEVRFGEAIAAGRLAAARIVDDDLVAGFDAWTGEYGRLLASLNPDTWAARPEAQRAAAVIESQIPLTEVGNRVRDRIRELIPELGG
jgi:hypothetical protein